MKCIQVLLSLIFVGCASSSTWHFDKPPSTLVVTQRAVVQKKQPVLFVVHDKDGEWQFLADTQLQLDPVVEVTFRDLVTIDSTIADVAYLKRGWKAWRTDKSAPWNTEIYK